MNKNSGRGNTVRSINVLSQGKLATERFTLEFVFNGRNSVVRLDGKKINFDAQNRYSKILKTPGSYSLEWFILGDPGDEYRFRIIEPKTLDSSFGWKLDDTGKDANQIWIELRERTS